MHRRSASISVEQAKVPIKLSLRRLTLGENPPDDLFVRILIVYCCADGAPALKGLVPRCTLQVECASRIVSAFMHIEPEVICRRFRNDLGAIQEPGFDVQMMVCSLGKLGGHHRLVIESDSLLILVMLIAGLASIT